MRKGVSGKRGNCTLFDPNVVAIPPNPRAAELDRPAVVQVRCLLPDQQCGRMGQFQQVALVLIRQGSKEPGGTADQVEPIRFLEHIEQRGSVIAREFQQDRLWDAQH